MTNQSFIAKVTILLLSLQSTASNSAKSSSSPVHEIINERIDDKPVFTAPSNLPYGNPLAGNSQQNARLHAQNQQAMFNAERIRQHKAQILRWTKTPPQVDSYMKAYQESQENHQLALEQQQIREQRPTNAPAVRGTRPQSYAVTVPMKMRVTRPNTPVTVTAATTRLRTTRLEPPTTAPSVPKRRRIRPIGRNIDRRPKVMPSPEPMKITKEDAIITDRNRNHRSHGSNDYHQYLQMKRYQTVYVSPGPTYDQGVTIKPNGSPGSDESQNTQEGPKLYTEAVPSKTQYVYPKQYNQMQHYESLHGIDTLSSLLNKSPSDQASELNALINSGQSHDETKGDLNTPIDLYFYLKDPTIQTLTQHYDQANYAQLPQSAQTYAQAYADHTENGDMKPTKEEIDDIEDPHQSTKAKYYGFQTVQTEPVPETTTTKSNNYYKVEVASQTISAGHIKNKLPYHSKNHKIPKYYKEEENSPSHQLLQYVEQPLALHYNENEQEHTSETPELNLVYSHQNALPQGVQHLTEDGTGVSAYGEDNLHYASNYEFGYRVRDTYSGNDFGHREAKQNGETRGQYYVLLPDGRMQNVQYSAGPEGFHADISYDHLHVK